MIFQLSNPYDKQKAQEWLDRACELEWNIDTRHICPKRTDRQNRYLHAILGLVGAHLGMPLEDVKKEVFKKIVNPSIFKIDTKKIGSVDVERWKSTAILSTAELSLAIDRFRFFCQSELDIYIATPDDDNFIIYCEQQIENAREFI